MLAKRGLGPVIWAMLAVVACFSVVGGHAGAEQNRPKFATGTITLSLGDTGKKIVIPVEFAQSDDQHNFGLMHRDTLDEGTGMLFIFPDESVRSFWMKNTLIPLDMIFFDRKGHFVASHENVPPLTLVGRSSRKPAQYVLELNAGSVSQLGITAITVLHLPSNH